MSNPIDSKWNVIRDLVASYDDVDAVQFNALMERVVPQALSDGFFLMTVDNSFLKSWIERNFVPSIRKALEDTYGVPFSIVVEVDNESYPDDDTPQRDHTARSALSSRPDGESTQHPIDDAPVMRATDEDAEDGSRQHPSDGTVRPEAIGFPSSARGASADAPSVDSTKASIAPRDDVSSSRHEAPTESLASDRSNPVRSHADGSSAAFRTLTFENFMRGESNRMAYSMAVQVAEIPGRSIFNPLFIYGKSGLGKTHLMRAIQNYINSTQPELNTVYEDTDNFVSGYVNATIDHTRDKNSYQNFIGRYENADVLLIDDVQFLQNKEGTIDIIFQIFNKLINQGKQIVLSADRAPKNIDIDERYTSRFAQGGTIDIKPPEVETKLAIVKSFISEHQRANGGMSISIPESIQSYIAESSGSNIRELKSAVTHLVMHMSYLDEGDISLAQAKDLLESHFSKGLGHNLTIDDIQKEVESFYRIKHADLIGQARQKDIIRARHMAMFLCRQLLDVSYKTIGKKFNRDHSTVVYSFNKFEKELLTDRDLQEEMEAIKKRINEI